MILRNDLICKLPARMTSKVHLDILLAKMVTEGASDLFLMGDEFAWVHLNSKKERISSRMITNKEISDILTDFYGINATSQLGNPKPINTDLEYKEHIGGGNLPINHRFRVNAVYGKKNGRLSIKMVIRAISASPMKAEDLDISPKIIKTCVDSQQGLILVVGGTGNGKSTTLSAILRHLIEDENSNKHIVTIEEPIEYVYDMIESPSSFVNQLEVGRCVTSFSEGLTNSLRMAPTDILIGEARDYETVLTSISASVTGHNVYSTVHANNVAETIQRMVSTFPEALQYQGQQNLIQALKMIVAQRLVPSLDGKRIALREYLVFTKEVKDKLALSKNIAQDAMALVSEFGVSMAEDAESKYNMGLISREEYERIQINYEE
jgi:defect-in-organelle-trafficking protein DotB